MPEARRRAAAVLASAALLLVSCGHYVNYPDPLGPRYEGSFAPRQDRHAGVRVVTFNIEHARHVDRAITLLRENPRLRDADLVFLQEMDAPGTREIADSLGLHYLYFPATIHPANDRDFGNAILSRWPIRDARKIVLPHLARIGHSERIATVGTVDIDGVPVRLYCVHLATPLGVSGGGRRDQAQAILDDASGTNEPVIVAGDLNSHGLGKVFAGAGFDWPSRRIGSTEWWFDFDHVFLRGIRLVAPESIGVVRDNRKASDHKPVWAVLALGAYADTMSASPRGGSGW